MSPTERRTWALLYVAMITLLAGLVLGQGVLEVDRWGREAGHAHGRAEGHAEGHAAALEQCVRTCAEQCPHRYRIPPPDWLD